MTSDKNQTGSAEADGDKSGTPKRDQASSTAPSNLKSLYSTPPPPTPKASRVKASPLSGWPSPLPVAVRSAPNLAPARRNHYQPYMRAEEVNDGLAKGNLIKGILRINQRNYEEAYIDNPDGDDQQDILILGLKSRNRALHSDLVVCKIKERSCWVVRDSLYEAWREGKLGVQLDEDGRPISIPPAKKSQEDAWPEFKPIPDEQNNDGQGAQGGGVYSRQTMLDLGAKAISGTCSTAGDGNGEEAMAGRLQSMSVQGISPSASQVEVRRKTNNYRLLSEMPGEDWGMPDVCLQKTATVVYVLEQNNSRCAVGQLKTMADESRNFVLFSPTDSRMPRMVIPAVEVPNDFFSRPHDFAKYIYVASLVSWPETSLFARGKLYKLLGKAGDVEAETEGMLLANQVDTRVFSDHALSSLAYIDAEKWTFDEKELSYRRDYRHETVFTIDPKTARDLDDALHIKRIDDLDGSGRAGWEVGVHIADVSYFVEAGTELDHWAANRGNTIYLVHKMIPMLPDKLSEKLCSLNQGVNRLAFSVVWKMDEEANICDQWFGRTVIQSCAKLSYDEASEMISNPEREDMTVGNPECKPAVVSKVKASVIELNKLARILKHRRVEAGSLRLDQPKMKFSLEKESADDAQRRGGPVKESADDAEKRGGNEKIWVPTGVALDKRGDANYLVEEFMLLANMAVAKKISDAYPKIALLRRHPRPKARMLRAVIDKCSKLGFPIYGQGQSSKDIGVSLMEYTNDPELRHTVVPVLVQYLLNTMQLAVYFCASHEIDYHHYALNVDCYTHFTSPIRRYPDLVVHRLLAASLGYCSTPDYTPQRIERIARNCNEKKLVAKTLSDASDEMFFGLIIKQVGSLEAIGIVVAVLEQAFDILLVKYGIIKRIPNKDKAIPVELISIVRVNLVPMPNSTKFSAVYIPSEKPLTFKEVAAYVDE